MSSAPKLLRLADAPAGHPRPAAPARLSDEELFIQFSPYVAGIALRLLGRDGEVDDLVQEVFFAAFKQRDQLRDAHAAKSWLAVIAVRTARHRLRRRRLREFVGLDTFKPPFELRDPALAPDDCSLLSRVYEILDRIHVDCRLAWILRYVEGEKLEGVAERCGCSLATAKRRIATAHARLLSEMHDG